MFYKTANFVAAGSNITQVTRLVDCSISFFVHKHEVTTVCEDDREIEEREYLEYGKRLEVIDFKIQFKLYVSKLTAYVHTHCYMLVTSPE